MENNKKTKQELLEQIKNLEKQNTELKCTITSLKDRASHMSERNNQLWHEKSLLTDWVFRILTYYNLRDTDLQEMLDRDEHRIKAFDFVINNVDDELNKIVDKKEEND